MTIPEEAGKYILDNYEFIDISYEGLSEFTRQVSDKFEVDYQLASQWITDLTT